MITGKYPSHRAATPRAASAPANTAKALFSPHDLRGLAATHMASIGVPRLVLSKVLTTSTAQ